VPKTDLETLAADHLEKFKFYSRNPSLTFQRFYLHGVFAPGQLPTLEGFNVPKLRQVARRENKNQLERIATHWQWNKDGKWKYSNSNGSCSCIIFMWSTLT
jgi:hypothetical protein